MTRSGSTDSRVSRLGEWAPPRLTASPISRPKSSQASSAVAQTVPPESCQTSAKLPMRAATRCGSFSIVTSLPKASVKTTAFSAGFASGCALQPKRASSTKVRKMERDFFISM